MKYVLQKISEEFNAQKQNESQVQPTNNNLEIRK